MHKYPKICTLNGEAYHLLEQFMLLLLAIAAASVSFTGVWFLVTAHFKQNISKAVIKHELIATHSFVSSHVFLFCLSITVELCYIAYYKHDISPVYRHLLLW